MSACTFFGDSKCNSSIYPQLLQAIEKLITTEKVSLFYVGNNGNFDKLTQKALSELSKKYPDINCLIVLAYLPGQKKEFELPPLLETIYPEGIEKAPLRFAINRRNKWMLEHSSFVIAYPSPFGNSSKISETALYKSKKVINLNDNNF